MELTAIIKNKIRGIFRLKKKKRVGGRRKKTIATLLTDTVYKALKVNERMRLMIAFQKNGYEDILEKNSPINLAREQLQLLALERAKELIRNNPEIFDPYVLREIFKIFEIEPPPGFSIGPEPLLSKAEKRAEELEELRHGREYFKELKEIEHMIVGDKPKYGGISRFLTPEVALQFLSMITALIAARQQGNGSPSLEPKIIVEKSDGIVEMSFSDYQRYLIEKGLSGQDVPELKPDNDSQGLIKRSGNIESDPQPRQPVGEEAASNPVSLRVSEWAAWVGKDPAEFVMHMVTEKAKGDTAAQAALTFLQHCSLKDIIALLEANKGNTDDPAVKLAITTLLENQGWLQAVIDQVKGQTRALGDKQE